MADTKSIAKKKPKRHGSLTHEEAFADYVAIPPHRRSYTTLAQTYVARMYYDTVGTARSVIGRWAREHGWQERIKAAATERSMRLLEESAEIDADTFHKTSQRLNELVASPGFIDPANVTRIRESVRKPEPKGSTNVNVQLDVQISQIVEKIAEAEGLNDIERAEFQKDVEKYLAEVNS